MSKTELVHQDCMSCGQCVEVCPLACIDYETNQGGYSRPIRDLEICTGCGECLAFCPAV